MGTPLLHADLHGNAPDSAPVALLLVDVINDLEYEGGAELLRRAQPAARRLARLKLRARAAGIPVVYANDNFGRWRSSLETLLHHVIDSDTRGAPIARLLAPAPDDYVVLKPKHSAFYATTLDVLLDYLGTRTLVIAGLTTGRCVLFTAVDAFIRDFRTLVPRDCSAAITPTEERLALRYLDGVLRLDTAPSTTLDLKALLAASNPPADTR